MTELENTLQSFNNDSIKHDVCRQIKELANLIEEEVGEATLPADSESKPEKKQKITLPLSGKVISANGDSLRQACELVAAWDKSTRAQTTQEEVRHSNRESLVDEPPLKSSSRDDSMHTPKLNQ